MLDTVEIPLLNSTMENQATVSASNYISPDTLKDLESYQNTSIALLSNISSVKTLVELSMLAGGYVRLLPEHHYLPALIGNDSRPVFLYQIVELIDEFLDYDKIQEECPTLSFSQIAGAVSFLRKVAQINSKNIDIDEMEDDHDIQNPELLEALRNALADVEVANVFSDIE